MCSHSSLSASTVLDCAWHLRGRTAAQDEPCLAVDILQQTVCWVCLLFGTCLTAIQVPESESWVVSRLCPFRRFLPQLMRAV